MQPPAKGCTIYSITLCHDISMHWELIFKCGVKFTFKLYSIRMKQLLAENKKLTAAIEAKESSPAVGWVTSAPKMIVGTSKTKGIPLGTKARSSTVFCPQT